MLQKDNCNNMPKKSPLYIPMHRLNVLQLTAPISGNTLGTVGRQTAVSIKTDKVSVPVACKVAVENICITELVARGTIVVRNTLSTVGGRVGMFV